MCVAFSRFNPVRPSWQSTACMSLLLLITFVLAVASDSIALGSVAVVREDETHVAQYVREDIRSVIEDKWPMVAPASRVGRERLNRAEVWRRTGGTRCTGDRCLRNRFSRPTSGSTGRPAKRSNEVTTQEAQQRLAEYLGDEGMEEYFSRLTDLLDQKEPAAMYYLCCVAWTRQERKDLLQLVHECWRLRFERLAAQTVDEFMSDDDREAEARAFLGLE
jgi:hypothetical protein